MNCYLLVGGSSRRMGRPKADVAFGGSTLLGRVAEAARGVFGRVIAVQRPGGAPADALQTICEMPHDEKAPIFGIARALQHAGQKCFIMAIDYPLITTEMLRFLADRFEASTAPLLAPRWSGKLQMLCAGYSPALLPLIEQPLPKGDVLTTAKVAGVLAAKKTSSLIPLTHPVPLNSIDVTFDIDRVAGTVEVRSIVRCDGKTGVEMEALTACAIASLT